METGFVFAAYDRDNVCQGIALWEDFRTSRSLLSFALLKFFMKVPLNTLKKLNEGWDAICKNHYQGIHCYLR